MLYDRPLEVYTRRRKGAREGEKELKGKPVIRKGYVATGEEKGIV